MATDRELWKTMTASEIRQLRKKEAEMLAEKEKRLAAQEKRAETIKKKNEMLKEQGLTKVSASIEVPDEIAFEFKAKLKKDKLKAKDIFDIAVYQYVNDELRINKIQPVKE